VEAQLKRIARLNGIEVEDELVKRLAKGQVETLGRQ